MTLDKTAGKLLGSMLQPGDRVAIIFGRVDDIVMIDRKNGAKKVLEDIGIEIVTEQSGYDHLGNPKPVMGTILQTYPNLKGVVTTSDRIALEALIVIEVLCSVLYNILQYLLRSVVEHFLNLSYSLQNVLYA